MATLPIIIGAFVVGLAGTVLQTVGGSTDPIAIVPGGLILRLLGIVFVGWAILLYVTLPCSVAWIVAVRVIDRIGARWAIAPRQRFTCSISAGLPAA